VTDFEIPTEFTPDFEKDYEIGGNKLRVQVQNKGLMEREIAGDTVVEPTWLFAIVVNGNRIVVDLFHWSTNKRDLTNENVCNHLAAFWGSSNLVTDAQKMPANPQAVLDEIVKKCAKFMFEYFMEPEGFDYDILQAEISPYGWTVVLMPNPQLRKPQMDRIMICTQNAGEKKVVVKSYVIDGLFNIQL
jgi:hypothetical protein